MGAGTRSPMASPLMAPQVESVELMKLPEPLSPRDTTVTTHFITALADLPGTCSTPIKRKTSEPSVGDSTQKRARVELPVQSTTSGLTAPKSLSLDEATESAFRIFDELWVKYLREYHASDEEAARAVAEEQVPEKYDELRDLVAQLLPRMSYAQLPRCRCPGETGKEYDVIEFQGQDLSRLVLQKCTEHWEQLAHVRTASDEGRVRCALVAVLAALSSRSQNCWLDQTDPEDGWTSLQKGYPKKKHQGIFEDWLKEALDQGARSYFSCALVHSTSTFRIAFAIGEASPRPASLLVTYTTSFSKCLQKMDGEGPLRGAPADWRRFPHFALQDLRKAPEGKTGTRYERRPASELVPEPAIRDLIRSGAPVIMLDAFAALASRAVCRTHGLSEIVKEELAKLLRDAKARGQAVIFMLGGDDENMLAEKVYLKPPFTDNGLRIGHLRWREPACASWAREKRDDNRLTIGLQLP